MLEEAGGAMDIITEQHMSFVLCIIRALLTREGGREKRRERNTKGNQRVIS